MFDNYVVKGFWYFGNVKGVNWIIFRELLLTFLYLNIFQNTKATRFYLALPFFSFFVFLLNIFVNKDYFETSRAIIV